MQLYLRIDALNETLLLNRKDEGKDEMEIQRRPADLRSADRTA